MSRMRLVAAATVILMSAWAAVKAGTVVVIDTWAYDQFTESGTATMYLGEDKLRVEFAGKETNVQAIFDVADPKEPVMWVIDPAAETYTKMDVGTIKKIEGKMREQFEMFENYMTNLSAEERAQIIKQYKKQLRQADDMLNYEERMKKTTYEKVAGDEKVNEWECVHLKGKFKNEVRKEVWVAPWSQIGLEPKDAAVLTAVANAFKGFAGETVPFTGQKVEGSEAPIDGFPVKTVFFEEGNKIVKQEIKEIRKEDTDPLLFVIPEGYTEESPEMP